MAIRLGSAQRLINQIVAIESSPTSTEEEVGLISDRPIQKLSQLDRSVQNFAKVLSKAKLRGEPMYYEKGNDRFMIHFSEPDVILWYEHVRGRFGKEDQIVCTHGAHKATNIVRQILSTEHAENRTQLPEDLKRMVEAIMVYGEDSDFLGRQTDFWKTRTLSATQVNFLCDEKGEIIGYERDNGGWSEPARGGIAKSDWSGKLKPNVQQNRIYIGPSYIGNPKYSSATLGGRRVESLWWTPS